MRASAHTQATSQQIHNIIGWLQFIHLTHLDILSEHNVLYQHKQPHFHPELRVEI